MGTNNAFRKLKLFTHYKVSRCPFLWEWLLRLSDVAELPAVVVYLQRYESGGLLLRVSGRVHASHERIVLVAFILISVRKSVIEGVI